MKIAVTANQKLNNTMRVFVFAILALGILLRVLVYLQNRNLFIDEANVARNLFERGYLELLAPLNYEQYAAPLFLWCLKTCAQFFGYSEYALRLFPLLAGIAALYTAFLLFTHFVSYKAIWYPLFYLATFFVFIRYSSELKQYGSDMLMTNCLILLSLKTDIEKLSAPKFILILGLAGSLAIWLSMPVVFILFSVGVYYFVTLLQRKNYTKLIPLFTVALIWVAQFLVYYITILKKQANSDYLQNYHAGFFINALPHSKLEFLHNWYLIRDQIISIGGGTFLAWVFHSILMIWGAVYLLRHKSKQAILILMPLGTTYVASAFHQYAFVERLMLFIMPLMMVLMACGLQQLLNLNLWPVHIIVAILALINCSNHNNISLAYKPMQFEELTSELDFVKKQGIAGNELYVHHGARPAFIYYTQVHPDSYKWKDFENAHLVWWDVNYDTLIEHIHGRSAFIFTSISEDEKNGFKDKLSHQMKLDTAMDISWCRKYAFIFSKP